jgi:hypothetical protein
LTEKNSRYWWIHDLQIRPGSHFGGQVLCHNTAWVSTDATADSDLGRPTILQFAQSIANLMALFNRAQIELRARMLIPGTLRPLLPISDAAPCVQSGLADCP